MKSPKGVGVTGPMGLEPESYWLASGDGSSRRGLKVSKVPSENVVVLLELG
jgi:hypothetical protein